MFTKIILNKGKPDLHRNNNFIDLYKERTHQLIILSTSSLFTYGFTLKSCTLTFTEFFNDVRGGKIPNFRVRTYARTWICQALIYCNTRLCRLSVETTLHSVSCGSRGLYTVVYIHCIEYVVVFIYKFC